MQASRRTGFAAVRDIADTAGTMASSNGKATVAPTPRRNVRRGSDVFVMIIRVLPSTGLGSPHPERRTLDRRR